MLAHFSLLGDIFFDTVHELLQTKPAGIHLLLLVSTMQRGSTCEAHGIIAGTEKIVDIDSFKRGCPLGVHIYLIIRAMDYKSEEPIQVVAMLAVKRKGLHSDVSQGVLKSLRNPIFWRHVSKMLVQRFQKGSQAASDVDFWKMFDDFGNLFRHLRL